MVSDLELAAAERALGVSFPPSYRAFLLKAGPRRLGACLLYGIAADHLWGDLVLMNQFALSNRPAHYVHIGKDPAGRMLFLDTSRPDQDGECPVILRHPGLVEETAAGSFQDFLEIITEI